MSITASAFDLTNGAVVLRLVCALFFFPHLYFKIAGNPPPALGPDRAFEPSSSDERTTARVVIVAAPTTAATHNNFDPTANPPAPAVAAPAAGS